MVDHAGQQLGCRIHREEPVAVLREGRRVPHRVVRASCPPPFEAKEPPNPALRQDFFSSLVGQFQGD
jgi:hypothetical protein